MRLVTRGLVGKGRMKGICLLNSFILRGKLAYRTASINSPCRRLLRASEENNRGYEENKIIAYCCP